MKSFATLTALLTVLPLALAQGQLQINSLLGVVECEPILITWSGGSPSYYLSFIPANQPGAAAIKQFDPMSGTSLTWTVDLPAGTSFTSELKDASGQPVFSGVQTVEKGTDQSCLNGGTTEAASGTSSSAVSSTDGTSATSSVAAAATKLIDPSSSSSSSHSSATTGTTVVHVASSGSATATASTTTATSTENGATRDSSFGAMGIAGVLGLIGAALF